MIINHQHRFVFVHIPKCAGMYVRKTLADFDDFNGYFTSWREHPELGYIQYTHLPLETLAEYFEEQFKMVSDYASFAVIRDPVARFPSSMAQKYKNFKDKRLIDESERELRKEITKTIEFLSQNPRSLAPEYMHFRRQVDFVFLDGKQVVDNLYPIGNVMQLLADISQLVDEDLVEKAKELSPNRRNQNKVYRNSAVRAAIFKTRAIRSAILGSALQKHIRNVMRGFLVRPRGEVRLKPFESDYVKDFVQWFYADDMALYDRIMSGTAEMTAGHRAQ